MYSDSLSGTGKLLKETVKEKRIGGIGWKLNTSGVDRDL